MSNPPTGIVCDYVAHFDNGQDMGAEFKVGKGGSGSDRFHVPDKQTEPVTIDLECHHNTDWDRKWRLGPIPVAAIVWAFTAQATPNGDHVDIRYTGSMIARCNFHYVYPLDSITGMPLEGDLSVRVSPGITSLISIPRIAHRTGTYTFIFTCTDDLGGTHEFTRSIPIVGLDDDPTPAPSREAPTPTPDATRPETPTAAPATPQSSGT